MTLYKISPAQKLSIIVVISLAFFVAEIAVGFRTGSLALIADAFHYLNDLIGFIVALAATVLSRRTTAPKGFSFGWARASVLGAFFNGVFLLALGVSIFFQSIERCLSLRHMEDPRLVLIMGCAGLVLNTTSAVLLGHEHPDHGQEHVQSHIDGPATISVLETGHNIDCGVSHCSAHMHHTSPPYHGRCGVEDHGGMPTTNETYQTPLTPINAHVDHRHSFTKLSAPRRDLGMTGALVHIVGDALNNIGVIIAALVIMLTEYEGRFYADPGVSMGISVMILLSSVPLVKISGSILMQSAPAGVDLEDVKHDLERISGVVSVHELHIWRLDQKRSVASAQVVVSEHDVSKFLEISKIIKECLHYYGVDAVTLQPNITQSNAMVSCRKALDANIPLHDSIVSTHNSTLAERGS